MVQKGKTDDEVDNYNYYEMKMTLTSLKFDVFKGKFYEPGEFIDRKETDSCDTCPICMELTKTTLAACKHYLCHRCSSNKSFRHSCPLCRVPLHKYYDKDFVYVKDGNADDDDDDDDGDW